MALTYTPEHSLGTPCPDFFLTGVDGKSYGLKDFIKNNSQKSESQVHISPTAKPLVVMFICNHCPYVKAIEDRLIQLGHDLKKENIPVVAIASNDASRYIEDSFENLKKRWREKEYPFPYLYDETQEVAKSFGAVCTPDFFVYDHEAKLAYRGRLDDSWKDPNSVKHRELYNSVMLLNKNKKLTDAQIPSMGCSIKWKTEG